MTDVVDDTVDKPQWDPHDRPSARTDIEREKCFQRWLAERVDKELWSSDEDELRDGYMRRYTRPNPPVGMPLKSAAEIRGDQLNAAASAVAEGNAYIRDSAAGLIRDGFDRDDD